MPPTPHERAAVSRPPSRHFQASGHLVDSGILKEMLDVIVREGGAFEITRFEMGRTNLESSHLEASFSAPDAGALERIARRLTDLGAETGTEKDARLEPAPADGVAPDRFYTPTHHDPEGLTRGPGMRVQGIRMDGEIEIA